MSDLTSMRVRLFLVEPAKPRPVEIEPFTVDARDDDHAREVIREKLEGWDYITRSVSALANDPTKASYVATVAKRGA